LPIIETLKVTEVS